MKSSPRARSSRVPTVLVRLWPLSVLHAKREKPLSAQFPMKLVWRGGELQVQCGRLRSVIRDRMSWASGSVRAGTHDELDLRGALHEFEMDLAEAAFDRGDQFVPPAIAERWLELRARALRVLNEGAMVRA